MFHVSGLETSELFTSKQSQICHQIMYTIYLHRVFALTHQSQTILAKCLKIVQYFGHLFVICDIVNTSPQPRRGLHHSHLKCFFCCVFALISHQFSATRMHHQHHHHHHCQYHHHHHHHHCHHRHEKLTVTPSGRKRSRFA